MWSPVNVYALPTEQDIIQANEAIKQLESRWDDLMNEITLARAKADQLSQQIFERKAWLAPVRKLPDEILSHIFISHAQIDWSAPVILGAVCRVWRRVVLTTPRAWAQVNLDSIDLNMLPFWIQRCGGAEIHALSGLSAGASIAQLYPEVNLVSLTLDRSIGVGGTLGHPYPKLRTLQVRFYGIDSPSPTPSRSIIDVARFPNLLRLHLDSVSNSRLSHFAIADGFPPLQELAITNAKGIEWIGIVKLCAHSLQVLEVGFQNMPTHDKVTTIDLPLLKHLAYQFDMSGASWMTPSGSLFPLSLTTPLLESYHESQNCFSTPLHSDVETVSELWLQKCVSGPNFHSFNLKSFKNLRTIHTDFDTRHGFKVILRVLDQDLDLCVNLETIHNYGTGAGADAGTAIATDICPLTASKEAAVQTLRQRISQKENPIVIYHQNSFPLKRLEFSQIVMQYPPRNVTTGRASVEQNSGLGLNTQFTSQWNPLPIPVPNISGISSPMSSISLASSANGINGVGNAGGSGNPMFPFPFF